MQQPNTYQYRQVMDYCGACGYVPDIVLCTSQLKTIKQLVANGSGISVLPNFVTCMEKIFVRRPLIPEVGVQASLFWGKKKKMSRAATRFMRFMKKYTESPDFKRYFHQ